MGRSASSGAAGVPDDQLFHADFTGGKVLATCWSQLSEARGSDLVNGSHPGADMVVLPLQECPTRTRRGEDQTGDSWKRDSGCKDPVHHATNRPHEGGSEKPGTKRNGRNPEGSAHLPWALPNLRPGETVVRENNGN